MINKKFFKTKDECEVTFAVAAENAESVVLVAEFNNWKPVAMKPAKDGAFKAKTRLPKEGQFQFRYLVDAREWHNDEAADAYQPNEYGEANSIVSTITAS